MDGFHDGLCHGIIAGGPGGQQEGDPFRIVGRVGLDPAHGAEDAVALDSNPAAIANLKNNLEILRCPRGQILQTDALRYLHGPAKQQFDVVFLDPPFHQDLLANTCNLLEQNQWLGEQAWVYTESEAAPSTLQLPGNWRLHREKKTGQVHYALWQRG